MDLNQMLKEIKENKKEKAFKLSESIKQDKIERKKKLEEIKNQNVQLNPSTTKKR